MPSYTDEQKRKAVDMIEECGGSVTRAIRRLGYSTRHKSSATFFFDKRS
nr:hypothetical protein [Eggerthella sp. AM16-19]